MVGPDVSNLCRGAKEGLSGNSPVPAHMGAWPEREAPAGEFASANFAVEGGTIRRSPFFLRGVSPESLLRHSEVGATLRNQRSPV